MQSYTQKLQVKRKQNLPRKINVKGKVERRFQSICPIGNLQRGAEKSSYKQAGLPAWGQSPGLYVHRKQLRLLEELPVESLLQIIKVSSAIFINTKLPQSALKSGKPPCIIPQCALPACFLPCASRAPKLHSKLLFTCFPPSCFLISFLLTELDPLTWFF